MTHHTRRRVGAVLALLIGCLLVSGCEAPRPEVTFYGNKTAVATEPVLFCVIDDAAAVVECPPDADGRTGPRARLALGTGGGVQINVGDDIGSTPWQVYFQFVQSDGQTGQGRSPVLTDGRLSYTLVPFQPSDQLLRVEVQSGLTFVPGQTSGVDIAATRSWLLEVDPLSTAPELVG